MVRKTDRFVHLLGRALRVGFTIRSWNPGDGVTRYRFFRYISNAPSDYHEADGYYTALGIAEAEVFVAGAEAYALAHIGEIEHS